MSFIKHLIVASALVSAVESRPVESRPNVSQPKADSTRNTTTASSTDTTVPTEPSALVLAARGFVGGFLVGIIPVFNITIGPLAVLMPSTGGHTDPVEHAGIIAGYITAMACWRQLFIRTGIWQPVTVTEPATTYTKYIWAWPS